MYVRFPKVNGEEEREGDVIEDGGIDPSSFRPVSREPSYLIPVEKVTTGGRFFFFFSLLGSE